jgi:hypothetical protein
VADDLHQKLLAELDDRYVDILAEQRLGRSLVEALRAVVELHAPVPYFEHTPDWLVCHGCDLDGYDAQHPPWPCSTIQAITRELGVVDA